VRKPPIHLILTTLVLLLAVALRVADPEPVARLRLSIFDSYLRLSPRTPDPGFPVRIVDIDEASLARVGQWPWPRRELAEIIENLRKAGAATISVDLILAEPDRLSPAEIARHVRSAPELAPLNDLIAALPSNDDRLAAEIAKAPVVLGLAGDNAVTAKPTDPVARFAIAGDDPKLFVPAFRGGVAGLPVLAAAATGRGAVNWLPSQDHIVRRVPLLLNIAGALHPSLSIETLRVAGKETTLFVRSSGGSGVTAFGQETGIETIRVGTTVLPTDADGQLWLNYARSDPHRYISAYRVLDGSFNADDVDGRHIMIGASATGLLDLRATPLEQSVPGVEIHAQALEQMLSGEHLLRPAFATGAELLFLVTAGALVAGLIRRAGPIVAAVIGALSIAAVSAGSWLAFSNGGYLFDPVYPSLALLALYLTGSLFTYVKMETDRARVRAAFSHYVSPPLVDELAKNHDKLKLGGEMREVTLLFADVRGFSRISEGMDAEALIRFINKLFTPLSDIILEKRGTIDKFMGDAVMAFWNAPVADPQHAANACRAALAMQAELTQLNRSWAAVAAAEGQVAPEVRIGIGLNTGACCVGNVGSPQRFDYSVLGDAVNIAARLEEATKSYAVPIIAGARTAEKAQGFALLEIDTATLRGKDNPDRLFALLGDETVAASGRFRELAHRHAALIVALKQGDKAKIAAALAACRALGWPELEGLFTGYEKRANASA
jgi:adenylate cyclase